MNGARFSGTFGEKLRAIRKYRGISLAQVDAKTTISRAFLSKVERGDSLRMCVDHLASLCFYYKLTDRQAVALLLGRDVVFQKRG